MNVIDSRKVRAEAVAWLARLQASNRDCAVESGLREWLAASPEHAAAFERATDVWDDLGGVPTAALLRGKRSSEQRQVLRHPWTLVAAGAMACLALVVGLGVLFAWRPEADLSTRIGEQRMVTLEDGSRVVLNTDTRVVVEPWNDGVREVRLVRGEAYFEVAKNPAKPFVVVAGDKEVIAIGTAFVVRRQPGADERISVTMVEGTVAVTDPGDSPQAVFRSSGRGPTLTAGQLLVIAKSTPAAGEVDQPRIETVTAWRRGEVILDNTSLKDAIAEMNRYTLIALVIEDGSAADLPVSGIFRTGDSESFATAVATLYGLTVVKDSRHLILSGSPSLR